MVYGSNPQKLSHQMDPNRSSLKQKFIGINQLPSEILVSIFELLDVATRMSIEGVCKRWMRIARNHSWSKTTKFVAKQFRTSVFANDQECVPCKIWRNKLLSLINRCAPYLKNVDLYTLYLYTDFAEIWRLVLTQIPANQLDHLDISHIPITSNQLNLVADRFGALKSVNFHSSLADTSTLSYFFKSCCLLEKLDLFGLDLTKASFEHLPGTLTSLNVSNCQGVDDTKLFLIGIRCLQLNSLSIEAIYEHTEFSPPVFNEMLYQLQRLDALRMTAENFANMPDFARIPQLKILKIDACECMDEISLASIGKCSQLNTLVLLPFVTDHEDFDEDKLQHLTNLNQLKCFHLGQSNQLTDDLLKVIARQNPGLEALRIPGCGRITVDCLLYVLDNCHQLENLIVGQCKMLKAEAIEQILHKLRTIFENKQKMFSLFCSTTQLSQETRDEYRGYPWLTITCYSDKAPEWEFEYT